MKLVKAVVVIVAVVVVGSLLGMRLNEAGLQAVAPQLAAVAQPVAAPAAAPAAGPQVVGAQSVSGPMGMVGVLQAVGSQSLSLQTREGMHLLTMNGQAGLDQLTVGDKLAVWVQPVNGQNIVTKIVVVPQSPQRTHYVGLVSSVNGDKVDVVGQQGETTTFRVDQTLQTMPAANRPPQVGDQVTVVAKPDPLGDGWLAVAIVTQ
jgi:hypothetical protein